MATTLTIGGTAVDLARLIALGRLTAFTRGGYPTLSFSRRGGKLPTVPDPYLGKEAVLAIDGTAYFRGDVVSAHPDYQDGFGWVISYQCHGLRHRGDRCAYTDPATGTDSSGYNLTPEDPAYSPARAGRTVGQILADALAGTDNVAALAAAGLTVGTATTADLATLTIIPPNPCYLQGERLLTAVEGFLSEWAPNYMFHIQPSDGQLRFLDTRTFTPRTFTLGVDPVSPSELSRDWSDCFPRVLVRGAPVAVMALFKLSEGGLFEAFDHDGLDNATAKATWQPTDFRDPSAADQAQDTGTCTCPSTTTVTLTSSRSTTAYAADAWDQTSTGKHGTINLSSTVVTGVTQFWTARVVANTAQSAAGGSFTVTIDAPLPHTNFDKYTLSGVAAGASVVWVRYQIANAAIVPKLTNLSTYPQPFINAGGGATLTSAPMGAVLWPIGATGPPFNTFPLPFRYAAGDPYIYFAKPTYITASNRAPSDVWALIPYWQSDNRVASPPDVGGVPQYAGTVYTAEGRQDTLTVQLDNWRDPAAAAQVQAYADDLLDSVKNTIVEGTIAYHGLLTALLTPGVALSVTGSDYTTGWETAGLPVTECELDWPLNGPLMHDMSVHCSNRHAHLSAAGFLRPERTFASPFVDFMLPFGGVTIAEGPLGDIVAPLSVGAGIAPVTAGNMGALGAGNTGGLGAGNFGAFAPKDMGRLNPGVAQAPSPGAFMANQTLPGAFAPQDQRGGSIPTNAGKYLQSQGAPTAPGQMGLPTGPGDLGLPTNQGEYLQAQGAPLPFGGRPFAWMGRDAGAGAAEEPPEEPPADEPTPPEED
jgi:hypothetical protein